MAETDRQAQRTGDADAPSRRFNLKTLLILVGVFFLEGVAISALFILFGPPEDLQADSKINMVTAEAEKLIEIMVVKDRFPNTRSCRDYLYESQIYIQVRKKHEEQVQPMIERMKAQLTMEIAAIFRAAEPSDLNETTLGTLNRRVHARLSELLGKDADGNDYIERVLIPKCTQYRIDL